MASETDVAVDSDGIAKQFKAINDEGTLALGDITFRVKRVGQIYYDIYVGATRQATNIINGDYFTYSNKRYKLNVTSDQFVSMCYFYVSGFDRYTTYLMLKGDSGWCTIWNIILKS